MDTFMILVVIVIVVICGAFLSPKKKTSTSRNKKATLWDEVKFFVDINKEMKRDYILIIDKSALLLSGMKHAKLWRIINDIEESVRVNKLFEKIFHLKMIRYLAPHITRLDPDGITLYFFDSSYKKFDNITTAQQVNKLFSQNSPGGSTNLASVLQASFFEHFSQNNKQTTILVVTDGQPDSQSAVKRVIIDATVKIKNREDLSVSFIQIGDDAGATSFLESLDDELVNEGAKFDIVDTLTSAEMKGLTFSQLVQKSIMD